MTQLEEHTVINVERETCRYLVQFVIEGDLRFISHRDTMRMLTRAVIRADLPVAYTQGFNPHVRLAILVPRPTGVSTTGDYALLQLMSHVAPEEARAKLHAVMPEGAAVVDVRDVSGEAKPRPQQVAYCVTLPPEFDPAVVAQQAAAVRASDTWVVDMSTAEDRRSLDIRPYLLNLDVQAADVSWACRFIDGRSPAPRELCAALNLPWTQLRHQIIRTGIELHQ